MALRAYARTNADKRTLCAYRNAGKRPCARLCERRETALCESWEWLILVIFSNALA